MGRLACIEGAGVSILLPCEPGLHIPAERKRRLNWNQRPCDLLQLSRPNPASGISLLPRSPGGIIGSGIIHS